MKRTVIFTGAGVSASFGYPLTGDILPIIVEKINRDTLFNDVTRNREISGLYRMLLKQLLVCLSPGIAGLLKKGVSRADLKAGLPLVTELLSQLEHQIASGHAVVDWNFEIKNKLLRPSKLNDRWEMTNLRTLFEWAIINAINNDKKEIRSPAINQLLAWITARNTGTKQFISVVSTNYDVALEWELLDYGDAWNADKRIDFGVSWRDPVMPKSVVYNRPDKPLYRILKLHGSTDWLKCRRCGFIYINPTVDIYTLTFKNVKQDDNTCHCGYWPLQPVLVTMSYVRNMDEPNLLEIWRNTFEELRMADEWIIAGYSLPPEDFDIRSLFLRALHGREKKLRIKVIQKSRNSEPQYDRFFGKGRYTFLDGGFEENIAGIIKNKTSAGNYPFY